ncbi:MAG: GGDEF domain-containing protein, partial [Eubacteriales bacterium]|nr:GGDEF domain-containing protein [Eubacteriales bacterium]
MQVFLRIDLNIFMAAVCIVMYFANRAISEKRLLHNRIFRWLILSVLSLLVLESLTWMLDGSTMHLLIIIDYIITVFLFLLTPVPAFLWSLYVESQIFHDVNSLRKLMIIFGIPIVICALLTITTPLSNLMFYFDQNQIYQRGPWYPILAVLSILPLITSAISVWIHRSRISKKSMWMITIFSIIALLSAAAQIFFYGLAVIWSSITISILLAQTNLQNDHVYLDHLTGVFNRRQMDIHLADRVRMAREGRPLSCILLDINHFKAINDTYGHVAGDDALKDASVILQSSIRKRDFLARYGGDEFVILTDIDNDETLQMMLLRIRENTVAFNETKEMPYKIRFSAGCAV